MAIKKKPTIEIPIKMFFSDTGVNFFIENKKRMNKFTMADSTEQYGVFLKSFTPASVQHMLKVNYVSRIEVSRAEFTSKRSEMMDLSKLIVYGFLYKIFDDQIFDLILESELVMEWNRGNLSNPITHETKIKDSILSQTMTNNKKLISEVRHTIKTPLITSIMNNSEMQADEKNTQIFLMDKYLDNLRPLCWFLLVKFSAAPDFARLVSEIRQILQKFQKRSKLSEYLSLMLMELNASAESLNLSRYIDERYKGAASYEEIAFDPVRREEITNELLEANQLISVAWSVGEKKTHSIGTGKKFKIFVYNTGAEYLSLKESVDKNMHADAGEVSLLDFYKTSNSANADMGMYYLSYLVDECEEMDIKFNSNVSQTSKGDSFISLILQF